MIDNNEEQILCKANIASIHKNGVKAYYAVACALYILFIVSTADHYLGETNEQYRFMCFSWGHFYDGDQFFDFYFWEFILIIIYSIVLFFTPKVVFAIQKSICSQCNLTLTDKQIRGTRKGWFNQRQIQIDLEKLDNITEVHSIMDTLRSGKTLRIASNSGVVKFSYVQNADEFSRLAMQQAELKRKKQESTTQPTPVIQKDPTLTEKIQELQHLKEMGVLSEEEFEAKRKELIAKL